MGLSQRNWGISFVLSLSLGMFLGSLWASRELIIFGSALFQPSTRLVCVVAALLLAMVFRDRPLPKNFFFVLIAFTLLHMLAVFFTLVLDGSTHFALGVISTLFEGSALTLFLFLYLSALIQYSPREIATNIAIAFLAANLYDSVFINVSGEFLIAQWLAGKIAAVGLLAFYLLKVKNPIELYQEVELDKSENSESHPDHDTQQRFSAIPQTAPARIPQKNDGTSAFQFSNYLPYCIFVMIIALIQGIYMHLTGLGGAGHNAFFDLSIGIYVIGVRIIVLMACLIIKGNLRPTIVVASCTIVWVTGLLFTTLFWNEGTRLIGALLLEAGMYALQVLNLTVAVQIARNAPSRSVSFLFAMIALTFFNHITRLFSIFWVQPLVDLSYVTTISLFSIWIIVCAAVIYFMIMNNRIRGDKISRALTSFGSIDSELSPKTQKMLQSVDWNDQIFANEIEFSMCFKQLCEEKKLTQREREIVFEAIHGYTIDSIAGRLDLSKETVKTYLSRAYRRMGTHCKQDVLKLIDSYASETNSRE